MGKLIATYPILYHSKQYQIGEELPVSDAGMREVWLETGTAAWVEEAAAPAAAPLVEAPKPTGTGRTSPTAKAPAKKPARKPPAKTPARGKRT